ncbi:glutaredoxin family protein [Bacillus sp. FJAT-27986]|uniref:glutaredoxin family protein n=1 Tax=Bacillus sp. FJAT-27986 TaxID=1743146 RepID=UPI0020C7C496|nr:glutaredoxin family protein [Bacillus sp. FJAT-27986]
MSVPIIHFYTKKNCPLCEEAKDLLKILQREMTFTLLEVDIYSNDKLLEQYGLMIPVVEISDQVIQYGRIDLDEIRRYLT